MQITDKKITISPWKKYKSNAFPESTKAAGPYLNSMLAVQDAKARGFDEALLLNEDNSIAEGSGQNIFIIKDGIFHTNDKHSNILMGITRLIWKHLNNVRSKMLCSLSNTHMLI